MLTFNPFLGRFYLFVQESSILLRRFLVGFLALLT